MKLKNAQSIWLAIAVSFYGAIPCLSQTHCKVAEGHNPAFVEYLQQMKERFCRNLSVTEIPRDVTIRFFLTAMGHIKDISVMKSSGDPTVDLACIDAAYCASPIPPPPVIKTFLRPPPEAWLYEPSELGEGVYTFTFPKHLEGSTNDKDDHTGAVGSSYKLPLIPSEVQFRYPGMFTVEELKSPNNYISVNADPYLLECVRSPWSLQYSIKDPPATKEHLLKLTRCIADKYINKKKEAAQQH